MEEKERLELLEKESKRIAKRNKIIAIVSCAVVAFAIVLFKVIIPTIKYNSAIALIDEGDYVGAYEESSAMDGFKDSEEKMKEIRTKKNLSKMKGVKAGDYITYGAYEQDNDTGNGQEEIEWLVLEVKDNKALVISKYALDCKPYNIQYEDTTWEKCSLRSWLNSNFIAEAFTVDERNYICETTVNTNFIAKRAFTVDGENYISETTVTGNDTQDEIFLLSINEVEKYFPSYNGRQCMVTEYAKNKGAYTNNVGCCWWWLRSPGTHPDSAAGVDDSGDVFEHGDHAYAADNAVRPALWINLES